MTQKVFVFPETTVTVDSEAIHAGNAGTRFQSATAEEEHERRAAGGMRLATTRRVRLMSLASRLAQKLFAVLAARPARLPGLQPIELHTRAEAIGAAVKFIVAARVGVVGVGFRLDAVEEPVENVEKRLLLQPERHDRVRRVGAVEFGIAVRDGGDNQRRRLDRLLFDRPGCVEEVRIDDDALALALGIIDDVIVIPQHRLALLRIDAAQP